MTTRRSYGLYGPISGMPIDFDYPEEAVVVWEDLFTISSNIRRYNGCIDCTLLSHHALCTVLARAQYGVDDLLAIAYAAAHDLHECYIGDVNGNLKKRLPDFQAIESKWEQAVHNTIGLPWDQRPTNKVKFVDLRALLVESRELGYKGYQRISTWLDSEPTELEVDLFNYIQALTPEDQWAIVMDAIEAGKNLLLNEEKELT